MIVATANGLDFLLVAGVLVLACAWVWRRAIEKADRELQREFDRQLRRAMVARELDEVPDEWLSELDDIRRLPETAA